MLMWYRALHIYRSIKGANYLNICGYMSVSVHSVSSDWGARDENRNGYGVDSKFSHKLNHHILLRLFMGL